MLLVIDGSALAHAAYFSSLPFKYCGVDDPLMYDQIEKDSQGRYVNAVGEFFHKFMSFVENYNPDGIAVCFDKSRQGTFRRRLYPAYKAQRPPKPTPLAEQIEDIKRVLVGAGIKVLESSEYEADDYAGSLAASFSRNEEIRIYTRDRDYLQLVSPHVKIWMPHAHATDICEKYGLPEGIPSGCVEYNEEVLFGEYGLLPEQVVDWKGVAGDPSDNIPGVKGVSDKTIVPLIAHYGSIDRIYTVIEQCKTKKEEDALGKSWREVFGIKRAPIAQLRAGKHEAFFFRELTRIKTNIYVGKRSDYDTSIDFDELIKEFRSFGLHELEFRAGIQKGVRRQERVSIPCLENLDHTR